MNNPFDEPTDTRSELVKLAQSIVFGLVIGAIVILIWRSA